jgi:hypothetical protein
MSDNGQLEDGTITVSVKGGVLNGKTLEFDAMVVKLASEPLEAKHKMRAKGGKLFATAEFAVEFDKKLKELGYESTPTIAIRVWSRAHEYFAEVQKKTKKSRS